MTREQIINIIKPKYTSKHLDLIKEMIQNINNDKFMCCNINCRECPFGLTDECTISNLDNYSTDRMDFLGFCIMSLSKTVKLDI